MDRVAVDQVFQMFDMSMHSRDIRDQSRKLTEIAPNFGRFSPSQILGSGTSRSYTHFISPASQHIAWKKFCDDTPTSPEVIGAHTVNFKPNFKLSLLNFFRGSPLAVGVCASKCWSICKSCKNLRGQHPQGSKYSLPKNVRLGGSVWAPITRLFVDQSSPNFLYPTWKGL